MNLKRVKGLRRVAKQFTQNQMAAQEGQEVDAMDRFGMETVYLYHKEKHFAIVHPRCLKGVYKAFKRMAKKGGK